MVTGVSAPATTCWPEAANVLPAQRDHSATVPAMVMEQGATFTMRPPARTWVRNHASAGKPSARNCLTYSAIGMCG